MKVAVCISGHLRTCEQTIASVRKNLLDCYSCDVFIHTWEDLGYQNLPTTSKIHIIDKYQPVKLVIEPRTYLNELKLQCAEYAPHLMKLPKPPYHMASMFYKIYACHQLFLSHQQQSQINYDWVIRLRADLLMKQKIHLPELPLENQVITPISPWHPQWCDDRFALGNPNEMEVYASTFHDIPEYFRIKEEYFPEKLLQWSLDQKSIHILKHPLDLPIIR